MSFGYSAGDFIAGGTLIYQLIKTLSGTQCPSQEYREALEELGSFQRIFVQVSQMAENPNLSPATINSASHIVLSSMTLIGDFAARTKSYRGQLSSWQNMGWVLFKADELKALKDALHIKMASISLLLNIAQFYEQTPSRVASRAIMEVESTPNVSPLLAGVHKSLPGSIEGTVNVSPISSTSKGDIHDDKHSEVGAVFPQLEGIQNEKSVIEVASQASSIGGVAAQGTHPPESLNLPQESKLPVRQHISTTRVVDISPRKILDEDSCRKRLTTYEAYTMRKIIPRDSKEKATWAKVEINKEPLSEEDILKAMKRLNESRRTVQDKKAAFMPFQQGQINHLLDGLTEEDNDENFQWSLAQLDSRTITNRKYQRETLTITAYVKRAPLKGANPIALFTALENSKNTEEVGLEHT